MKRLIVVLLLSSCGDGMKTSAVSLFGPDIHHDQARGVTCYATRYGLSCLPDSVLLDGGK
jgi:hypothetical protein